MVKTKLLKADYERALTKHYAKHGGVKALRLDVAQYLAKKLYRGHGGVKVFRKDVIEHLAKKHLKKITFERGKRYRAERDVLARKLMKHENHIKTPYGLSTYLIKKGVRVKDGAIDREFREQKRMMK